MNPELQKLLAMLDERGIATHVGRHHDNARLQFAPPGNQVNSFTEFRQLVCQFYNFQLTQSLGAGPVPEYEAWGRVKPILEQAYRRRRQTINNAIADAIEGTNGGVRGILDTIADAMKEESVQNFTEGAFDNVCPPNSWSGKVELMRQFQHQYGEALGEPVRSMPAEAYASHYKELLQSFVHHMNDVARQFRSVGDN
jgi:hypothetical protein